jgi:small subunit ribosomal protein S4
LGVAIADLPKHNKAEFVAPGMHGFRSQRLSEYGIRLREKQRLKAHYSVLEKQFRRYMTTAKKAKGNTAVTLQQLLETRLDNVVRRLGVVRSIWAARQLVAHGHVKVNGKKVDVPSFSVDPNSVITFKEKAVKLLRENMESLAGHQVPAWIEFNPAQLEAKVVALPVPEQIPFEVDANKIIEFYR